MRIAVQVVAVAGGDSSPALLVATESHRYLFNAGEGLQRFCMEHRVRLSRVDGIFVTRVCNETMGGLPGMLLTLADMGKRRMALYGGPGITDYMRATRHFMRRDDVEVRIVEAAPRREDDGAAQLVLAPLALHGLDVEAFPVDCKGANAVPLDAGMHTCTVIDAALVAAGGWPLPPPRPATADGAHGAPPSAEAPSPPLFRGCAAPSETRVWGPFNPARVCTWPSPPSPSLPQPASGARGTAAENAAAAASPPPPSAVATSFVCTGPPTVGRFHPARAAALGLRSGPSYGRLQRGETVEADVPVATARAAGLVTQAEADAAEAAFAAATAAAATTATGASEGADISAVAVVAAGGGKGGGAGGGKGSRAGTRSAPPALPAAATVRVRVAPHQVKDDDAPGLAFAVLACPTLAHLRALRADAALRLRLTGAAPGGGGGSGGGDGVQPPSAPRIVFHVAPAPVSASAPYVAWLADADAWAPGGGVRHVLLGGGGGGGTTPPLLACAQAAQAVALHVLAPRAFTLPHPMGAELKLQAESTSAAEAGSWASPLQAAAASRLLTRRAGAAAGDGCGDGGGGGAWMRRPVAEATSAAATVAVAAVPTASAPTASPPPPTRSAGEAEVARPLQVFEVSGAAERPEAAAAAGGGGGGSAGTRKAKAAPTAGTAGEGAGGGTPFALSAVPTVDPAAVLETVLADASVADAFSAVLLSQSRAGDVARACSGEAPPPPAGYPFADVPPPLPAGVRVVFTGTSSAVPSKYRNVSGAFVLLPPSPPLPVSEGTERASAALLLDCGEGTVGQLMRRFGAPGTAADSASDSASASDAGGDSLGLRDVDAALLAATVAWISHMHADHHLGLLRLICERNAAGARRTQVDASRQPPPPLLVVGPTRLLHWLLEAARVDAGLRGGWRFADAEHFVVRPAGTAAAAAGGGGSAAGLGAACGDAGGAEAATSAVGAAGDDCAPARTGARGFVVVASPALPPGSAPSPSSVGASGAHVVAGGDARDVDVVIGNVGGADVAEPASTSGSRGGGADDVDGVGTSGADAENDVDMGGDRMSGGGGVECSADAAPRLAKRARVDDGGAVGAVAVAACPAAPGGGGAAPFRHRDAAPSSFQCVSLAPDDADAIAADRGAPPPFVASPAFVASTLAALGAGGARLAATHVVHCHKAYALRLDVGGGGGGDGASPWSLVYSGDTRPCAAVVALGRGGDAVTPVGVLARAAAAGSGTGSGVSLLIHEATFDDTAEGAQGAADKRHSTAAEALAVARACGARHVLLTHFSARYPKLPVVPPGGALWHAAPAPAALAVGAGAATQPRPVGTVFVAYDLMTLRGEDVDALPGLLPALHDLFREELLLPATDAGGEEDGGDGADGEGGGV